MIVRASGIKAWILILAIIAGGIVLLGVLFHIVMFLLPLIIVIVVISYLLRILNKVKKGKGRENTNWKEKKEERKSRRKDSNTINANYRIKPSKKK